MLIVKFAFRQIKISYGEETRNGVQIEQFLNKKLVFKIFSVLFSFIAYSFDYKY